MEPYQKVEELLKDYREILYPCHWWLSLRERENVIKCALYFCNCYIVDTGREIEWWYQVIKILNSRVK